jgi:hypothetical protein
LEHILGYSDKIVRVGGRSKSEYLKDHTLFELKKMHERPRGIGRLYRSRDEVVKQIKTTLTEMYEEPCVTLDFINDIQGLRPRQIESLRRIGEREKNRKTPSDSTMFNIDGNDSDDDWVIGSVDTTPRVTTPTPVVASNSRFSRNNRNNKKPSRANTKQGANSDWAGGNPNLVREVKENAPNPVEIWLKDAMDYVQDDGVMSSYAEELKQSLLEQEKGLVFDDIIDERELIEEEELKDYQEAFKGEDLDLRGNKNPFIQIGKAYQKQTESIIGERPERKIINYQKTKSETKFDAKKFNFFDDDFAEEEVVEEDHTKDSLARWMNEDDVSMWPLTARLKAHKIWADQRNTALEAKLNTLMNKYYSVSTEIRKAMAVFEAKICRENRVVGMTSTAAVSYFENKFFFF